MKIFVSLSTERHVLYRGSGEGSDSRFISWWAEDKSLAEGYQKYRVDGQLDEKVFFFKKVLSLSHDNFVMKPKDFYNRAYSDKQVRQSLPREVAISLAKEFEKKFTPTVRQKGMRVRDYMEYPKYKKAISNLLIAYGYQAIRILEKGTNTYGVLNHES